MYASALVSPSVFNDFPHLFCKHTVGNSPQQTLSVLCECTRRALDARVDLNETSPKLAVLQCHMVGDHAHTRAHGRDSNTRKVFTGSSAAALVDWFVVVVELQRGLQLGQ